MVDGTHMQLTYMLMYGGHCVYEVVDNSIFFFSQNLSILHLLPAHLLH